MITILRRLATVVALLVVSSPAQAAVTPVDGTYATTVTAPDGTLLSTGTATAEAGVLRFGLLDPGFRFVGANAGRCGDDELWAGLARFATPVGGALTLGADGAFADEDASPVLRSQVAGRFTSTRAAAATWTLTLTNPQTQRVSTCVLKVALTLRAAARRITPARASYDVSLVDGRDRALARGTAVADASGLRLRFRPFKIKTDTAVGACPSGTSFAGATWRLPTRAIPVSTGGRFRFSGRPPGREVTIDGQFTGPTSPRAFVLLTLGSWDDNGDGTRSLNGCVVKLLAVFRRVKATDV